MPQIVPPDQGRVESRALQAWHNVFKPTWETLVGLGYAGGASTHTYDMDIVGLDSVDGEVSFFGNGFAAPAMQPWPDGGTATYYAVSDSASDTCDLYVHGLGSDGLTKTDTVTLTGTTPVNLGTYKHINAVLCLNGSDRNVGNIFVSEDSTAVPTDIVADNIHIICPPGWGKAVNPTMMAATDEVMVFPEINISADRSDGAEIVIYKSLPDGTVFRVTKWYLFQSAYQNKFGVPIVLQPGEFIRLTIERSASGTGSINAACDLRHYGLTDSALPNTAGVSVLLGG